VLAALGVALMGGAIAVLLSLATGTLQATTRTTTVVEPMPVAGATTPVGSWAAVYASAAAGTVDIAVHTTTAANLPWNHKRLHETVYGTGFLIDGRGDILTATHVVSAATSVTVSFPDGATRTGTVLAKDNSSDIALLRVDPAGLTLHPLPLGSDRGLVVGDAVAMIGDPLGFNHSLSVGVVSALGRRIAAPDGVLIAHSIQTDAAMNPGSSGGPLLNSRGQVIGFADQIATGSDQAGASGANTSTGVGFAIPIDLAKFELPLLEGGRVN
jgi:putative serine protease PepD